MQAPEIFEVKADIVPQDKIAPPEIIPAKEIKSEAVSKPTVIKRNLNVHPVGQPKIVPAGAPKICVPGENGFSLPEIVPAIDSPFAAGVAQVTIAKEPQINNNNPASFSTFKVLQGLKTNDIFPMMQDKAGNLWIACFEGGVCKYDGRSFTNYTTAQGLSNDNVWSMLEDSKGNLWFGTLGGGLNKFDGKSFTNYKTKQGLSDNGVISIFEDSKGNLWVGTENGGVNKYDGKSFTHYTTAQGMAGNHVRTIVEDSSGMLWFATRGGISKFDGRSFSNYTSKQGLKNTDIMCMLEDRKEKLWFSSYGGGICKFDGRVFEYYSDEQGLPDSHVYNMLEDRIGNLWFAMYNEYVIKYDGNTFTRFGIEQGLSNSNVHSIMEDKAGNLWLGTNDGLCKYNGETFTHFNSSTGFSQKVFIDLNEDKAGNIWMGIYGDGVKKFDGKSVTHYTSEQGLTDNRVMCVSKDNNDLLLVGTHFGGLNKFDGNTFSHFENFPPNIAIWAILKDKKGNTWIGTSEGLYKFDGKNFTHFGTAQGLSWESIISICEDKNGDLWLGTELDGVINKLDLSAAKKGRYSFTHYDIKQGSSLPFVYSIIEDKNGNLWFGTSNSGVLKFDGKKFTRYTTAQGLSNNNVNSIVEDKMGAIWFLTENGLCKMPSQENNAEEKIKPGYNQPSLFKTYLYADGFFGVGSHYNSMIIAHDGNIWAGASNWLTCYHPQGDVPDTIAPVIQLSGVELFDENINWSDMEKKKDNTFLLGNGTKLKHFNFTGLTPWYNQPENLQLNYNNNYITFQFIGITTNRPKEVRYQHFLEGLDKNWSSVTDKPEAIYNNLPYGKYTFKIKAVNSEGYWSKELNYSFVILPPWWRTWWAYLVYVLGFVVMIWTFTWHHSRQLKAENILLEEKVNKRTKELEQSLGERYELSKKVESQQALLNERLRISRELHDDIGSTLGSISIYSEVAKKRTEKKQNTNEVLAKIGLASRELIDKMSDIVWSLNPNNESFEQLQNRMMAFAGMILTPRNILYNFTADGELKKLQFTSGQRKNIFLIFKEALYNIVKYADCKKAGITLTVQTNNLIMIIQDDGKGFDVSHATVNKILSAGGYLGGNGIKNMHARADDMKAKLCINSIINEGTTVQLTLRL